VAAESARRIAYAGISADGQGGNGDAERGPTGELDACDHHDNDDDNDDTEEEQQR
jgi:hypothetical protein